MRIELNVKTYKIVVSSLKIWCLNTFQSGDVQS